MDQRILAFVSRVHVLLSLQRILTVKVPLILHFYGVF